MKVRDEYLSAKTSVIGESGWTSGTSISPFKECLGHDHDAFLGDIIFLDKVP
jgi:hypothetical protein